ncbi:MAG: class II aldolase/adducin family protein [bacterium]
MSRNKNSNPVPEEVSHPELVDGCNPAEGYTKFSCHFIERDCIDNAEIEELIYWRKKLHVHGFIGMGKDNISFGNISKRISEREFIISGTNTGKPRITNKEHYSKVRGWNILENFVACTGLIPASSETLSHAAIYEKLDFINAVIHLHDNLIWEKYRHLLPTTADNAAYGTVKIAIEIKKILSNETASKKGIIILGGHRDGILVFGQSLEEAYNILTSIFNDNKLLRKSI